MNDIFIYLKSILPELQNWTNSEIEDYIIQVVLSSPYCRATKAQIYDIVQKNYYPGLFNLSERIKNPTFLLEESMVSFEDWIYIKIRVEMEQIYKSENLIEQIDAVGIEAIVHYCVCVLYFKNKKKVCFLDLIINQEYSDIFRRILMLLITGNAFYVFNNNLDFNNLGKEVVPQIIQMTNYYSLHERLLQSIASGMIGMDIKEKNISTAPISLECNLKLDRKDIVSIIDALDAYIHNNSKIGIDCFEDYYNEVILGCNLNIVWFTDDYIETIFEMKFIEEQMNVNKTLNFTIVPRYDSYSNDASYDDVIKMLELDELRELKHYYKIGRFSICRNGMDISTVDLFRMSSELYDIILKSDICVISGARAFEMTQGMKKIVYYTGIAVCKAYTESITGFSRNSGKLVFLRQGVGEHSFEGFKDRAWRQIQDDNTVISVAKITAKEYYMEKYK
ncbi:MAG: hypothetical protein K2G63_03455 [Oscillospiraceae bacterium]|nr:hypothetical protein [Oscillospiraceae bacterium]